MLTGLQLAWFRIYSGAMHDKQSAIIRRAKHFGIGVADDRHALAYQLADARAEHASEHLAGPGLISWVSSAEGDITLREQEKTRKRRAAQKRRARKLLGPILEREEQEDLHPSY